MKVKVLEVTPGIPLKANKTYRVNFETSTHYIIFNCGIWCGIYKNQAIAIEKCKELSNGQIVFNI